MLSVRSLSKTFADAVALDNVGLEVGAGQLFSLLGPSGCGKTTALRCIAGLERPDRGEIAVGGRVLFSSAAGTDVAASDRRLGFVFQSHALWPHMSVFDTVAFPLTVLPRRARPERGELRRRVERTLAAVRLDALAGRPATDLSGGERQRLALARALVLEPPLLLMDEPLSNLDASLRDQMRFELKRLQREVGVTALHVTHDQSEALALSDVVAVMRAGRIEQVGRPRDVYTRPGSRFVAEFLGSANLVEGVVASRADGGVAIDAAHGRIRAVDAGAPGPGARVLVAIRPEQIEIAASDAADGLPNHWTGVVSELAFRGDAVDHLVAVGDHELRVRSPAAVTIAPGTRVALRFAPAACVVLP